MSLKRANMGVCVDIRKDINDRNELLALPAAALRILEMVDKDEISLEVLSSFVRKDPALAGRLLKIANSSFYGLNQPVGSIQQAVMVLGLNALKCLILSASLFDSSRISDDLGIDVKTLYGNIIAVAAAGRKIAVTCGYGSPEEAFTSGLLHEVGLLFYLQNYGEEYKKVIELMSRSGNLNEAEKEVFGISHPEIGGLIAEKWRLPKHIVSSINNHHSLGYGESQRLDDIIRLAVAVNMQYSVGPDVSLEEKIVKISTISNRLGITNQQLDDIASTTLADILSFARAIDVEIDDLDTILVRANREIFRTYMSIQKLFRERQELTKSILDEERARGIQEAKQVAISTLSHYINNAAMVISGQSQILRISLGEKDENRIAGALPGCLDKVDDAIRKIVAVLQEISALNMQDDVEFFDKSKVLNMDDRINERLARLKESHPASISDTIIP
jgi:HD-like signal output (HDOD) protein